MQSAPDLKMLPRRLPSTNHVPSAKILGPGAKNSRPESQDFGELEFSVRVWEGKYSLQDEEDLVVDFVTVASKGSVDSVEYGDSILFSGASHPLEPIDTDLMKKPDPKCSVKSLSAKGPFLDDLSIKGHGNGKNPKNHEVGYVSSPFLSSSASQNIDTTRPLGPDEKECVWDASPSTNVSPHSSLDVIGVVKTKSVVKSCVTAYRSECIALDDSDTKCNVQGDSLESAKSSVSRASDSSGLSDDSNWTNLTGGANKPHQGNDPIWKAILAVRARDGILGMSHFRLLRRLGCGDIGSVYLSELSGTRCYFAMKVMDKESLEARKKLNRSQTEREILQLLDHPFLPTLYTHFETDRFSCLVMEFCSGGDLHTLRQRQPGKRFSEYAARFYAAEILLALEYLHMLGIIYRYLKPENVLVREDGHIMLSDFDLSLRCTVSPTLIKGSSDSVTSTAFCAQPACIEPTSVCIQPSCFLPGFFPRKNKAKSRKAKSEPRMQLGPLPELLAEPTQARSMSFVGTHEYLAPEIIKGEGHGSAVDWWTFGIFLHELLYGKTPFKGSGNRATLFNVVGQQLKIPDSPPTSYASRDLIKGLLMKEPQNRLGVKRGATEIKQHPFFEGVNWALIRSSTPPLIPKPVEIESPVKPGAVVEPVGGGHGGAGKQTVNTDVKAGGAKFLDFEFF